MTVLAGVGPATAARLRERGIETVADLLRWVPSRYEDYRRVVALRDCARLPAGAPVVVRGRVERVHVFPRRFLTVHLRAPEEPGEEHLVARWFRVPGAMAKTYRRGAEVALRGTLRHDAAGAPTLFHPRNVTAELAADPARVLAVQPVYPAIRGVPGRRLERLIRAALAAYGDGTLDVLPAAAAARLDLPAAADALRALHAPAADLADAALAALRGGRTSAHRRLAIEDWFVAQVALARERHALHARAAAACVAPPALRAELPRALGFVPTAAQRRAIDEVLADLGRPRPMLRLLTGDVGSGKTAVAFAAILCVAHARRKTWLMAPTEILAEQSAAVLRRMGAAAGLRIGLLTGGLSAVQRRAVLDDLRVGRLDVLVGTHALLDDRIEAPAPALVVVDEQQRFGVEQRAGLRRRFAASGGGASVPHLLVLSATPIPRTLAHAMLGRLDLSVLDERPPARAVVTTRVARGPIERGAALRDLARAVAEGGQAFAVAPAIDPDGEARGGDEAGRAARGGAGVVDLARDLGQLFDRRRIGVLHGRVARDEQARILRRFRDGDLDVLVATTIIEVGIDVPRATCMLIDDAERFGLAQLHQLRGRVGRGERPGVCWLCTREDAGEGGARLAMLAATADGFAVAELDLRQRGAGDLFGDRQSGGGLADLPQEDLPATLARLRDAAEAVLRLDPELRAPAHAALRVAVERRLAARAVFDEDAG